MTIVYVVTSGSYSAYGIEGVFSTKEGAEKYSAKVKDANEIAEWILDGEPEIKIVPMWTCTIDIATGNLKHEEEPSVEIGRTSNEINRPDPNQQWIVEKVAHGSGVVQAQSPISRDHARKLAAEHRQALLRDEYMARPRNEL